MDKLYCEILLYQLEISPGQKPHRPWINWYKRTKRPFWYVIVVAWAPKQYHVSSLWNGEFSLMRGCRSSYPNPALWQIEKQRLVNMPPKMLGTVVWHIRILLRVPSLLLQKLIFNGSNHYKLWWVPGSILPHPCAVLARSGVYSTHQGVVQFIHPTSRQTFFYEYARTVSWLRCLT